MKSNINKLIKYIKDIDNKKRFKNVCKNIDYANFANSNGMTPLMVSTGHLKGYHAFEILDMLLKHTVYIDDTDNFGRTALTIACRYGDQKLSYICIKMILKHNVDVNKTDAFGWTPLMHLLDGDYNNNVKESIKVLLVAGADINVLSADGRKTPLLIACKYTRSDLFFINVLITLGANIDGRDKYGNTPLLWIIKRRDVNNYNTYNMVKCLIKLGANVKAMDKNNVSVLDLLKLSKDSDNSNKLIKMINK